MSASASSSSSGRAPIGDADLGAMFADIRTRITVAATATEVAQSRVPSVAPGPTRAVVHRQRLLAAAIGAGWLVLIIVLLGARDHLDTVRAVCQITIPTVLGFGALAMALSLVEGRSGLGPSLPWTVALAVLPPVAFVVLGFVLATPSDTFVHHDSFQCGGVEVLASLVSMGIAALGLRQSSVTNARWRGALLGSAIGMSWSGLWSIHCTDQRVSHVVLGHGYPIVLCALIGAFVVSRFSRV